MQRFERGRRLRDVQDVADRRDRADDQRRDEHAAADEQDSRPTPTVVPVPALSSLSRHLLSRLPLGL